LAVAFFVNFRLDEEFFGAARSCADTQRVVNAHQGWLRLGGLADMDGAPIAVGIPVDRDRSFWFVVTGDSGSS